MPKPITNFERAFTIVELLIVIVVIGILATISVVYYNSTRSSAVDVKILSDLDNMDGAQTNYGIKNFVAGKEYYSGLNGTGDEELDFRPSEGNVIDVVVDSSDYCIRGYNLQSSTYKSISTAATKESSQGACSSLSASSNAVSDSP